MDFVKRITDREKTLFKIAEWHEKFLRAQVYRTSCGWDADAEDAIRIRKNDLPLNGIKALPNWKGKYYVDNWLWKGIKWLVSMQMGAALEIDVKSYLETASNPGELLEMEINWALDQFQFQDATEDAQYDRYYTGMGWVRSIYDTRRATPNYPTGTPRIEHVDCMQIWIDPAARTRDLSDMRYLFHQEYMDIEDLVRRYPKYERNIQEVIDPTRSDAYPLGLTRVITLQYRHTITKSIVIIEDQDSGAKKEFLEDEWMDFVKEMDGDEAKQAYQMEMMQAQETGSPIEEYEDWLVGGGILPEKVKMLGPIEIDEPAVFQAIYLPDINVVLETPQYVGKTFSYHCLPGYHEPDCAYSTGLATFMKDTLEESIGLMTILMVSAARTYKNEKLIQEDSLVNQEEYQKHGYELGVNPIVKSEWQQAHENVRAVENVPLPEFPRAISMLNDYLVNTQKTMTGAIDASIGLSSYSGQSGIQVAQLQTAARTYQREDVEMYRRFIRDICTWLKDQIIQHRNYPHQIPGLKDDNTRGLVDVATDITNRLDTDDYYIEVGIQDNQEVVKEQERQLYTTLVQQGFITPMEYLRQLDIPNPEKKMEEAEKYRGERQTLEILRQFPEAQQIIQQFVAGMQQGQNQQPANQEPQQQIKTLPRGGDGSENQPQ